MKNKIRAKFTVQAITEHQDGTKSISLIPVISGSEENKEFWKYTPSGKVELNVTNPDAQFEFGEYYIDFVKA